MDGKMQYFYAVCQTSNLPCGQWTYIGLMKVRLSRAGKLLGN